MATNEAGNGAHGGGREDRLKLLIEWISSRAGDHQNELVEAGEAFA